MKVLKRKSKKYPIKVRLENGKTIIIPKQSSFSNDWLRHHGCSLVAEYIALQWCGLQRKWPLHLLSWHRNHTPEDVFAKVTVRGVEEGINRITGQQRAKYYKKVTEARVRKAIEAGRLVIMEQKDPIHTIVLLPDDGCYMASHGYVKKVNIRGIVKTATSNKRYRGMVVVR